MCQHMSEAKNNPHVAEINWYEIDQTTHGSVAIYHSKEVYEANLAYQKKVLTQPTGERSYQLLNETHGKSQANFTSFL